MIAAVVLAAGQSKRMGRPKMILPWGDTTVIGQVVRTLACAGLDEILVVTGGAQAEVQAALDGSPAHLVHNPSYSEGEMTLSLQVGLSALARAEEIEAALVVLGDQPQIEAPVTHAILDEFRATGAGLVVPSFEMRRGHPWVIACRLWPEILALEPPATLRDFLNAQAREIHYFPVSSASVRMDLDTPEDYRKYQP